MASIYLPRLPTNWEQQPHLVARYWDDAMKEIEKTFQALLSIPAIQEALEDLDAAVAAAQAAADDAMSAASDAETAANESKQEQSLISSYIDPTSFTAPLISADSAGNVTIATHDRVYGDSVLNPTVEVTGATLATAAAPSSVVRIYYIDPSKAGGSVTFQFTIDPAALVAQGNNAHSVGGVTIPASGTNDGVYVEPPGYVDP